MRRSAITLVALWRERAAVMEPYAPGVAHALRDCAGDLERALSATEDTVSPAEAAALSGYTADAIGRMIRDGRLENLGSKRRPKVRVADLPRKPGRPFDPDVLALAAVRPRQRAG